MNNNITISKILACPIILAFCFLCVVLLPIALPLMYIVWKPYRDFDDNPFPYMVCCVMFLCCAAACSEWISPELKCLSVFYTTVNVIVAFWHPIKGLAYLYNYIYYFIFKPKKEITEG